MFVMSTGPYITTGPQSASSIGTPGTPQIASVLGKGSQNGGGSPLFIASTSVGIVGRAEFN